MLRKLLLVAVLVLPVAFDAASNWGWPMPTCWPCGDGKGSVSSYTGRL